MGEIADMVLDGILCQGCGAVVNLTPVDYPVYCPVCTDDNEDIENTLDEQTTTQAPHDRNANRNKKRMGP